MRKMKKIGVILLFVCLSNVFSLQDLYSFFGMDTKSISFSGQSKKIYEEFRKKMGLPALRSSQARVKASKASRGGHTALNLLSYAVPSVAAFYGAKRLPQLHPQQSELSAAAALGLTFVLKLIISRTMMQRRYMKFADFLHEWPALKRKTPEKLWPIMDLLYTNYKKHVGLPDIQKKDIGAIKDWFEILIKHLDQVEKQGQKKDSSGACYESGT